MFLYFLQEISGGYKSHHILGFVKPHDLSKVITTINNQQVSIASDEKAPVLILSPNLPKLLSDFEDSGEKDDEEMKGCSKLEWSCQICDTIEVLLNTRIQQARTKVKRIKNDAVKFDDEVAELGYFVGLSPELYQLLYLPKILQASHLDIGRHIDETKQENEGEEVVFTVMSPDEPWDACSEMSDFEFDLDIENFGVVTAEQLQRPGWRCLLGTLIVVRRLIVDMVTRYVKLLRTTWE